MKIEPVFGERLRGIYASIDNPQRDGFYVRTVRRTGFMNPGKFYEITDGKGHFWWYPAEGVRVLDRSSGAAVERLCCDCPPIGYPTDKTRCADCPRTQPTPADGEKHGT